MRTSLISLTVPTCLALVWLFSPAVAQEQRSAAPTARKGGLVQQLRSLSEEALARLKHAERHTTPIPLKQPAIARASVPQLGSALPATGVVSASGQQTGPIPHAQYGPRPAQLPSRTGSGRSAASRYAPQTEVGARAQARNTSEAFAEVHVETELPAAVRHSFQDLADQADSSQTPDSRAAADSNSAPRENVQSSGSDSGDQSDQQPLRTGVPSVTPLTATADLEPQPPQVSRIPLPRALPAARNLPAIPTVSPPQSQTASATPPLKATTSPPTLPTMQSASVPTTNQPASDVPATSTGRDMANARRAPVAPLQRTATLKTKVSSSLPTAVRGTGNIPTTMVSSASPERATQGRATQGRASDDTDQLSLELPDLDLTTPRAASAEDNSPLAMPELPDLDLDAFPLPPSASLEPAPAAEAAPSTRPTATASAPAARPDQPTLAAPQEPAAVTGLQPEAKAQQLNLQTPHIDVVLNGPDNLAVGMPAHFEVQVSNRDQAPLAGLVLRLDVPAGVNAQAQTPSHGQVGSELDGGATMLTWIFDSLPAGQSARLPIEMLASAPRNFGVGIEWTLMPVTGTLDVGVLAPQLEVLLEGPAEVDFGQANTYRLRIRNPGNAPARTVGVLLSAEPYGSSSTEIGNIPAGGEEVVEVELTFKQKGSIGISATASASNELRSATQIEVLVRQPELEALLEAPPRAYYGAPVDVLVQLSNRGDADAHQLMAVVALPAAAEVTRMPPGGQWIDGNLTWPIPLLAAGKTEQQLIQIILAQEGENRLQLDCTNASGLAVTCASTTDVEAVVDLKLQVNDPIAPAPVGGEVLYELNLTNRGSKAAKDVRVIAQFSEGIEPIRGTGHACRVIPGQLLFDSIPTIEAGQSMTLTVYAKAEKEGAHRFRAEVKSSLTDLRLVHEESTQYLDAPRVATPPGTRSLR